jgi:hypothetical protein
LIAYEFVQRIGVYKKNPTPVGWKLIHILLAHQVLYTASYLSYNYYQGPMIEAVLNRSAQHMREDINQIKDKSREFFEIDDSVPIGYTYDDLQPHQ